MRLRFLSAAVVVVALAVVITPVLTARLSYRDRMYGLPREQRPEAVIILGGRVEENGAASDTLANRVRAGVFAWEQQTALARKECDAALLSEEACAPPLLVLSGDNGWKRADEIAAMKALTDLKRVDVDYIVTDGQNARTIDSCWRAKHVLGVERAVLVTQPFHLPRALFLCNRLGLEAIGAAAENGESGVWLSYARDYAASFLAWWDVMTGYTPVHQER